MKGFVIYSPNQTAYLSEFLAKADGCDYTPVVAVASEVVEMLGGANVFNLPRAKAILHREVTAEEIAQTLSHIACWREIAELDSIAANEFALISEVDVQFSSNYVSALQAHIDHYLAHSGHQIVLLERSRQDDHWDDKIYTGEGEINSITFNHIEHYNRANSQAYLIRKSFAQTMLNRLDSEKPYWLAYRFGDFCEAQKLTQTLPLVANSTHKILPRPIKVKTMDETLDFILQNDCSVMRFGDGEFYLISGNSIVYQRYEPQLAAELEQLLKMESNEKQIICLPPMFDSLSPYIPAAQTHWRNHLDEKHLYYESICIAPYYENAFVFRPYMDWQDKSQSAEWFIKLRQLWQDKDLLIVEGETSRSGVGNDLFNNTRSIQRIICPATDAYSKINEIEQAVLQAAENRLVLLMLGPTAKVLAYRLSQQGIRAIDIGHIDSEYEWFKMGATEKVKFTHKHTADFNEADIQLAEDVEYESQIITKVI